MALNWKILEETWNGQKGARGYTMRSKIPGGWLVTTQAGEGGGVAFVPDPNHDWDGNSLD